MVIRGPTVVQERPQPGCRTKEDAIVRPSEAGLEPLVGCGRNFQVRNLYLHHRSNNLCTYDTVHAQRLAISP